MRIRFIKHVHVVEPRIPPLPLRLLRAELQILPLHLKDFHVHAILSQEFSAGIRTASAIIRMASALLPCKIVGPGV